MKKTLIAVLLGTSAIAFAFIAYGGENSQSNSTSTGGGSKNDIENYGPLKYTQPPTSAEEKIAHSEEMEGWKFFDQCEFVQAEKHGKIAWNITNAAADSDRLFPRSPRYAAILLGKCAMEQGRFKEALEYFATEYDRRHQKDISPDLAVCHLMLGNLKEAEDFYSDNPLEKVKARINMDAYPSVGKKNGLAVRILMVQGYSYSQTSRKNLRLRYFEQAHKLNPRNGEIAKEIVKLVPGPEALPWAAIMAIHGTGKTKTEGENRLLGFPEEQRGSALEKAKRL